MTISNICTKRIDELIHFIELMKINHPLIKQLLKKKNINHFNIINEALTHTSAHKVQNHEKLEFLGDAVLRLAASEFIERNYSHMKVGDRSSLRSNLVSDDWLTKVGSKIKIEKVIIAGPKTISNKNALKTIQAETTEALIGAFYKCFLSIEFIEYWLKSFWEREAEQTLSDPFMNNSKSALQEWCQKTHNDIPIYRIKQISDKHGDPHKFLCEVYIDDKKIAEGEGGSHKKAEKEAALKAINLLIDNNN